MALVKFMTSGAGRAARIVLGLAVLSIGVFAVKGIPGTIMAVVGLVPISGGLFDFCLIGFALGYPLNGEAARKKLAAK
jgi:hypothetical protein